MNEDDNELRQALTLFILAATVCLLFLTFCHGT